MLLRNLESTSIKLNKLAFDIKNFKFLIITFLIFLEYLILKIQEFGNLNSNKLNLNLKIDETGFMRIEINDSVIPDIEFSTRHN